MAKEISTKNFYNNMSKGERQNAQTEKSSDWQN